MTDDATPLGPKIMLVAGEASGDQLGGRLMAALKAKQDHIRFIGVGGRAWNARGLKACFR